MPKNYNSKYYLKKEINFLLNKLYIIKTNFELFKSLKSGDEKTYITDNIPFFGQVVLTALSKNMILELSKIIVDTPDFRGDENICIANLIEKYNQNKGILKLKKYYYVTGIEDNKRHRINLSNQSVDTIITSLSKKIDPKNKIYKYLKNNRHKELAHNDKAFGFKSQKKFIKEIVTYEELENYINKLYDDLNELNRSLFSTTTIYTYNFKEELQWLVDIIKEQENNFN